MPRERINWVPVRDWPATANARLSRFADLTESSTRVDIKTADADADAVLTWPTTLWLVDSSAGDVTLTLPDPATVPGFVVIAKKTASGNTVTLAGSAIDGATTVDLTAQHERRAVCSDGTAWVVLYDEGGGGGGGATDLGYTAATRVLTSSTGDDVTLPLASASDAGLAPAGAGVFATTVEVTPAAYGVAERTITDARATTGRPIVATLVPSADFDADDLDDVDCIAVCDSGEVRVTLLSPVIVGTYGVSYALG